VISFGDVRSFACRFTRVGGQLRKDVSPGRNDDMQVKKSEQSTEEQTPTDAFLPKSAEQPQ